MIPASGDGGRHRRWRRRRLAPIVGALVVVVAIGTVLTVRQISGRGPNWTGVVITVPRCPTSAEGFAAASDTSANRTQIDGLVWSAYSTSASASAVRSLMHQCTGLSPLYTQPFSIG